MNDNNINDGYRVGNFRAIIEADEFARMVTSSGEPGFLVLKCGNGDVDLRVLTLGQYFQQLNYYLSQLDDDHVYSEHVQLLRESCAALGLGYGALTGDPRSVHPMSGKIGAELYNALLETMRAVSRTTEFRKRVYDREYNAVRNYHSCVQYIDALFVHCHSRLLVLRLDFGYLKERCATIAKAQDDIEHFLKNRRCNSLFDTMVGYIIKLECTAEKGPHLHCFFFLDGSASWQHVYLAQEYGNYWLKITAGRGVFFNCNMKIKDYRYCGIGMIHHADAEMRQHLLLPIRYITKPDQVVKMKSRLKTRTFWRGEMPSVRSSMVGRPRKGPEELGPE
jgi:hypothetical protein